jgi:hypothetical protein
LHVEFVRDYRGKTLPKDGVVVDSHDANSAHINIEPLEFRSSAGLLPSPLPEAPIYRLFEGVSLHR